MKVHRFTYFLLFVLLATLGLTSARNQQTSTDTGKRTTIPNNYKLENFDFRRRSTTKQILQTSEKMRT